MDHILSQYPWTIQKKILDYMNNPICFELKTYYTCRKLCYIATLRENGELKYAQFVNDAFRFADVAHIKDISWNWFEWGLRKVYNGEKPWNYIISTNLTREYLTWLKKVAEYKYVKYGITSHTDYINQFVDNI